MPIIKRSVQELLYMRSFFWILTVATAVIGIFVGPDAGALAAFGSSALLFLVGRPVEGALSFLWFVRVEPAPSELLFAYAWLKGLFTHRLRRVSSVLFYVLGGFLLLNFVQILWSPVIERSVFFAGITAYLALISVLMAAYIRDAHLWKEVQRWYLWAVYLTAIIGVILSAFYLTGISEHMIDLYFGERPRGFFKDPNVSGAFVVTGLTYAISRLIFSQSRSLKLLIFTAFCIGGLLSSFSRGALLGAVAGFIFLILTGLVTRCLRWRRVFMLALVCTVILRAMPFIWDLFNQAYRFTLLTEYEVSGRFMAWAAGLNVFSQAPWGIGPGQFEEAVAGYFAYYSAHNTFLRVLVENGVVGLVFFIATLLAVFWLAFKAVLLSRGLGDATLLADSAWLVSSLVAIVIESTVIDTLHWRHLWLLIGFSIAHYRLVRLRAKQCELP